MSAKNIQQSAESANQNSQSRQAPLAQFGLRFGIVRQSRADRSINLETPEGQVVKNAVPIYPSVCLDYPAPPKGAVVLWGFADGLASQPFYMGVVRPPDWQPSQVGSFKITGNQVQLNPVDKARINGVSIAVEGALDDDGDTIIDDMQITPQIP